MISDKRAVEVAEKYYTLVLSYCYSFVGLTNDCARDITQDVFLLFQQKCPVLEDVGLYTWLMATACNKCHEYCRKLNDQREFKALDENTATVDYAEFFDLLDSSLPKSDEDLDKYIGIILNSLTPKELELYKKIYVEQIPQRQIAEELGLNENAVNARAHRLRQKLNLTIKLLTSTLCQLVIKIFF